jgi:intraflagellar transport protein 56
MQQYMVKVPDSILAKNLHACNTFRLQNGKAAESELQQFKTSMSTSILGNELVKHNLVVFRGGQHALRDLQPLLGIIPEARLNLVIYYMRKGDFDQAFNLVKELEPTMPQVHIVSAHDIPQRCYWAQAVII